MKTDVFYRFGLFVVASMAFVLMSPKWTFPPAAWAAPVLLIFLVARSKPWKSYVVSVFVLFISSLVSLYNVMPFPGLSFPIMVLLVSLQNAVPYLLHRLLFSRIDGWTKTLVFPFSLVAFEYLSSFGGGGSWSSVAYTQAANGMLIQATSLAGIWIITFAIGWFASLLFWMIEEQWNWQRLLPVATYFIFLISMMMLYGFVKQNSVFYSKASSVRVAGLTNNHVPLLKMMYQDTFGKELQFDEDDVTQNSSELAELNKGFAAFIEDPGNEKFARTRLKLSASQEELFALSSKEAKSGSQIIAWSEAAAFTIKNDEESLIRKGQEFARANGVYFLMTVASIHPGKIELGKKFIENKALLFGPDGNLLHEFRKNRPVPIIEPSVPGDGTVPVIETRYGKIAISICYDADFPQLMRQLGKKDADILLLPSGDWREVSPYHAQMAVVRAIENGTSMLRPVSGAVSVACDYNGNIIASRNYFDDGEKVVVAYLPTKGINTLYAVIGDCFAWTCIAGLLVITAVCMLRNERRVPAATSSQL